LSKIKIGLRIGEIPFERGEAGSRVAKKIKLGDPSEKKKKNFGKRSFATKNCIKEGKKDRREKSPYRTMATKTRRPRRKKMKRARKSREIAEGVRDGKARRKCD